MEIIGIAKPLATQKTYICHLVETELDKITGVAGKPHIAGRYKPGAKVNIGRIYNKVRYLNEKMAEIIAAATETEVNAAEIKDSFPLEE